MTPASAQWLFEKAAEAGLYLDSQFLQNYSENCEGKLYNSRTGIFSLLPKRVRKIIVDNKESFVDESVYRRMKQMGEKYKPVNVPPENN
jgi:hypothetical protein